MEEIINQGSAERAGEESNYSLSPESLVALEASIVADVRLKQPGTGVYAVWIRPTHPYADFVRTHEASYFPEVAGVSEEDELQTMFLALVDMRPGIERVTHGATITGVNYDSETGGLTVKPEIEGEETGMYTVDSLIERGNFSAQEFIDFYADKGVDVTKCIAVETNFRIGEKPEPFQGLKSADLAYLTFFNLLASSGSPIGTTAVFATINTPSIVSFNRNGLRYEPMMGRTDLNTEESELGKDSLPVAIYLDEQNDALFKAMGVQIPELFV